MNAIFIYKGYLRLIVIESQDSCEIYSRTAIPHLFRYLMVREFGITARPHADSLSIRLKILGLCRSPDSALGTEFGYSMGIVTGSGGVEVPRIEILLELGV